MNIQTILANKLLKTKAKVEVISQLLLEKKISIDELIKAIESGKDADKGTCIEALEFATKAKPAFGSMTCLTLVTTTLTEKAPRVKWESAKVIGNIAHLYPEKLNDTIKNLLINTEHDGTVVRWAAAFALGEIVKLKTKRNKDLIPALEAICKREEQKSIKKIYAAALKKALA